jgi:hypothetical protein
MKPKSLMLSAAMILASAAVAFAQTKYAPTATPSDPASGTTQPMNAQPSTPAMPDGTGSSAVQSNDTQPGSTDMRQAQTQPPRTSKHRAMAARHVAPREGEHDRATTALNLLVDNGYRDFSTFHSMGRDFAITASQGGRTVTVVVNPDTKTVRTQE